jgi:hypothetical protein
MHTAEPFVPEPSASEVESATGKFKSYKSPGVDQTPAEFIEAVEKISRSEIHNSLSSTGTKKKNCLTNGKSRLWHPFTKRVIKLTYHRCLLHIKLYPTFF